MDEKCGNLSEWRWFRIAVFPQFWKRGMGKLEADLDNWSNCGRRLENVGIIRVLQDSNRH